MIEFVESPQNQQQWAAIDRMIDRLRKPTDAQLEPVQESVRDAFNQNFLTESANGQPWEPLSFDTVIERVLLGYPGSHPILRRSGSYQSSFVDAVSADHVSEVEFSGGLIRLFEGSNDERVASLELGAGRMPARPVLDPPLDGINRAISDMLTEIINGR